MWNLGESQLNMSTRVGKASRTVIQMGLEAEMWVKKYQIEPKIRGIFYPYSGNRLEVAGDLHRHSGMPGQTTIVHQPDLVSPQVRLLWFGSFAYIPGVAYAATSMSPPFHPNLIMGQRFIQAAINAVTTTRDRSSATVKTCSGG